MGEHKPITQPVPHARATLAYQMLPEDANSQGYVHGGSVTKLADTAAGVCAARHARSRVATVAITNMTFTAPVKIGALVTVEARLVGVGLSGFIDRDDVPVAQSDLFAREEAE